MERKKAVERARGALHSAYTAIAASYPDAEAPGSVSDPGVRSSERRVAVVDPTGRTTTSDADGQAAAGSVAAGSVVMRPAVGTSCQRSTSAARSSRPTGAASSKAPHASTGSIHMISNSLPSGSAPYTLLVAPWSDSPVSAPAPA